MKAIWKKKYTVDQLNDMLLNSIEEHLGIKVVEVGIDYLRATMPVDRRTHQPFGILHGGASVVLAESLGSMASHLMLDENKLGVGIEVNANHIRSVREGSVSGIARPLHLGAKTHIWEIKICDRNNKLVCVSRLTVSILDKPVSKV